jgi:hypothetical protein
MPQLKPEPDAFKLIRKQILMFTIPLMLIIVAAAIILTGTNSKEKAKDVNILPYYLPIVGGAMGIGLYRGLNRRKILLNSYTLVVGNNLITRYQLNTPTVSIYRNDIKDIIRNNNAVSS